MNELFEKIQIALVNRELHVIGMRKEIKVRNVYFRFSEIRNMSPKLSVKEVRKMVNEMQRIGLMKYSFRHKKYMYNANF